MAQDEKLNIEILGNKLDASGSKESVDAREKRFYEALERLQKAQAAVPPQAPFTGGAKPPAGAPMQNTGVYKVDEAKKMLSLRQHPNETEKTEKIKKSILLILLGYKKNLNEEEVTIIRAGKALQDSGLGKHTRLTFATQPLEEEQKIIKLGTRNGARLKLTNLGETEAETILAGFPK